MLFRFVVVAVFLCVALLAGFSDRNTKNGNWLGSRRKWDAKPPTRTHMQSNGLAPNIVARSTPFSTEYHPKRHYMEAMKKLQHFHINFLNIRGIEYNFCVGEDGGVFVGRYFYIRRAVTKGNPLSVGLFILENAGQKQVLNAAELLAIRYFFDCSIKKGYIYINYRFVGHRQVLNVLGKKNQSRKLLNKNTITFNKIYKIET